MQTPRQQGYTGTTTSNSMNHVQRAVTYQTPRNAQGDFGQTPGVTPYRAARVVGAPTHHVDHSANGAAMPYGQARATSRLTSSGAVPTRFTPAPNQPQSRAFMPADPIVTAIANNLGHGVAGGQGSFNNGFAKTGLG